MKKSLIFLHLLLFLSTASAQSSLGLQVGVDYSKITIFEFRQSSFDNILEEGFAFPSSLFGVTGTRQFSKKMTGEISISHTLKRGIPKSDFGFDPTKFITSIGYNALFTSLSVRYRIFKNTDIGLGLLSRYLYNAHSFRADGTKLFASKNVNNLGLLINLGYDYDSFTFQLNYSVGRKLSVNLNTEFFDLVERIQSIDFRIIYKFTL